MSKAARAFLAIVAFLPLAGAVSPQSLQLTTVSDFVPSAALSPLPGPVKGNLQTEVTRITTQVALDASASIVDNLSLSATAWALADSLPTYDPSQVPAARLDISSRVLQLGLDWQILPGSLSLDLGKEIIHPSSGFFKTPLDIISRGAAGNVPQPTPAASPKWEEGWIGARLQWITGDFSLENFLSPRLTWSDAANAALQYLSLTQPDYQDQLRLDARLGQTDFQALVLLSSGGPGSADPALRFQAGAGLDASLGTSLTLRAEATLSDSQDRVGVVDPLALAVATQTLAWVPRALAGLTWSINSDVSLMAEYYYDGLGFAGADYSALLSYSKNRLAATPAAQAAAPDLAGQFGAFSSARHYAFLRLADDFTNRLTGQGWMEFNLQDLSFLYGAGMSAKYDNWGLSGSLTGSWGGAGTEAQALPFLWQLDLELQFYI